MEEEVKTIIQEARKQLKLECRSSVFDGTKKLAKEDLIKPQKPEEFTKKFIIEKILDLFGIQHELTERSFVISKQGIRHVDYECSSNKGSFILEAKPVNESLDGSSPSCAVNQIKDIFVLKESRDFQFGVATDGLKWILINPGGEIIAELMLGSDFSKLSNILVGKRDIASKKQEEISKRFFQWYNALMHGGSFKDLKGRQRKISPQESLVSNIRNVESELDREEIAQTIVDRLIFIKFIQAKGLIKSDVLQYLAGIRQDALKWTLDQLFFSVLNTEKDKRPQVDPKFDGIPYLNGSLFTKTKPEEQNQYYNVTAEILQKVIEFLDSFRFVTESEVEGGEEALDPEILGYIFERAMTSTDRKGTGAYYTPKYITRYISENTIYPFILEQARDFLRDDKNYKDSELPVSLDDLIENVSSRSLSEIYGDIVQRVRVLDPACGSGAFLLAASNVLLELYNRFEERLGLRNSPLALKKVILKNSIYGVDLNHEGIEIAKLRLWLWLAESYNPEGRIEPLPNIEYNIRAGNSLVGFVDISRFKEARLSLDDFMESEESLTEYLNERDVLINSYKEASGEVARELRVRIEAANEKVKMLLDIRLFQELMKKVGITSDEYRRLEPFHWGFEFHEVFSNTSGDSGFDVVIGNPPYVQLQKMKAETDILQKGGFETFARTGDIYCLFYEKGMDVLTPSGNLCYITSNKWMRAGYGKKLREYFIKYNPKILIDLGPGIFEGATVDTNILFLQKTENEHKTIAVTLKKENNHAPVIDQYLKENGVSLSNLTGDAWFIGSAAEIALKEKIECIGKPLKELDVNIYRGVLTGLNEAFIVDTETKERLCREDPKSEEILKPILRGRDIKRFSYDWKGLWLIATFPALNIDIDNYPAVKKYLLNFGKDRLTQEGKTLPDGTKSRKRTNNKWFETQDQIAYYPEFEKEKIVWGDIATKPLFSILPEEYYFNNTVYMISGQHDKYFVGVLNSDIIKWYFPLIATDLGKRGHRYFKIFVEILPIPPITQANRSTVDKIEQLVNQILSITKDDDYLDNPEKQATFKKLEKEIDQLTYKLYGLTPDEIKIVEGRG